MNTVTYTNGSGETYEVSELNYIISNIVFIDAGGNEFVYPEADSYFVVNEADAASKNLLLTNVDGSSYTQVRFGIGVDQSNYPLNGVNNFIPRAEEVEWWTLQHWIPSFYNLMEASVSLSVRGIRPKLSRSLKHLPKTTLFLTSVFQNSRF